MTTRTERAAAHRVVHAWRAKHAAETSANRPPGFSFDEAEAITGVDVETLERWACGLVHPSAMVEDDAGWTWFNYTEIDLLRAMIVADLAAAGVPPLVLVIVADGLADECDESPEDDLARIAEDTRREHVYPRSVALAERWFFDGTGSIDRVAWTAEDIADAETWSHQRAMEMAAEAVDTRGCVERGEAIVYGRSETAARLQHRLDAWWVAHPDQSSRRGNRG